MFGHQDYDVIAIYRTAAGEERREALQLKQPLFSMHQAGQHPDKRWTIREIKLQPAHQVLRSLGYDLATFEGRLGEAHYNADGLAALARRQPVGLDRYAQMVGARY